MNFRLFYLHHVYFHRAEGKLDGDTSIRSSEVCGIRSYTGYDGPQNDIGTADEAGGNEHLLIAVVNSCDQGTLHFFTIRYPIFLRTDWGVGGVGVGGGSIHHL